jgi:hypothetical protein
MACLGRLLCAVGSQRISLTRYMLDAHSHVTAVQVMGNEPTLYTVNLAAGSSSQVLTLGAGANWS